MKLKVAVAVMALLVTVCACQPVAETSLPSETEQQEMERRVQQFFKKSANVPPNVTLKLVDMEPAEIAGLLVANIEVSNGANTQKVPVLLSRDGRYLIQGKFNDLTIDPFQAVMEKIALKDEPMRGAVNATVTIVEYSDFQCPFCSRAYKVMEEQVLKEYGDRVRLVYKNFPLKSIHPWAESAALASECARQQGGDAFWKMYDFLFQNQKDLAPENVKEKTKGVINAAGLDVGAYEHCFENETAMDAVKADEAEAVAVGVRSTPTFFINGRKLEGAVPYEQFRATIEQALNPNAEAAEPPVG